MNLSPLQFTEPIYKILFETIVEAFIIVDEKGNLIMVNPRFYDLFGYNKEELNSLTVEDLIPDGIRRKHVKLREGFHQQQNKRSMGSGINLKAKRKDGSTFYVEISLNHIRIEGKKYVSALITDISERAAREKEIQNLNVHLEEKVRTRTIEVRESQELYSAIARNFPNGTINVFDKELNYIFVEGKELFQLGISREKLIGTNYLERISAEIRPKIKKALLSVFKGETKDFEIKFKDQYYRINAVPLSFDSKDINRILVVERNITEQKEILAQQKLALDKERHLNDLKSRFVSMASHEFRTPLSTMLSSVSLIEKYLEKGMPEKTVKHTIRIKNAVHGLTEVLNDILSVDKLETANTTLNILEFDYCQFTRDFVEEMNTVSKLGQTINLKLISETNTIQTDPGILKNILYNLMSNAIKYSDEGQEIIFNSIVKNDELTIEIIDKGIGIPKEDQKQLFTRFFRANNVTNIKGTGLGLNIVTKYLEMLNGSMTFESEENIGTTFVIKIPINQK